MFVADQTKITDPAIEDNTRRREKTRRRKGEKYIYYEPSSGIHNIRREDDAIRTDQYNWPAFRNLGFWGKTSDNLGAAHLQIRRRFRSKEDIDRICLVEVLAVQSEHL